MVRRQAKPVQGPARTAPSGFMVMTSRALACAALAALALAMLVTACAGELNTVGEALRLVQPQLPNAVVNEPYEAQVHAVGGLRPYTFQLDSGDLPPGISLQGGALRGTPTELGQFRFSIAVSDGNLSKTVQQYTLTVTEVPPPTFTLNPPLTEVRDAVTLRATVAGARELVAARALVAWDPQLFSLRPGSVTTQARNVALLVDEQEGRLQVDIAFLGRTLTGDHNLFTFVLEPVTETATLRLSEQVELLSRVPGATNAHHFVRQSEGRQQASRTAGEHEDQGAAGSEPEDAEEAPPADEQENGEGAP